MIIFLHAFPLHDTELAIVSLESSLLSRTVYSLFKNDDFHLELMRGVCIENKKVWFSFGDTHEITYRPAR